MWYIYQFDIWYNNHNRNCNQILYIKDSLHANCSSKHVTFNFYNSLTLKMRKWRHSIVNLLRVPRLVSGRAES